ncbi:hypothetical protein GCM10025864_39430 [Luteimicrobium album]|uniref:Glycosyltransferase n=1 Tax=Luteimicrobium album TaxID=1054550 RepID=A0ABQ6I5W7_9MICO|nr:hypothetical protein [Luteimicrobium album]GMA26184.1 hypothetical protein GCM10025864_39430 [Luteimicrobium album]
MSLAIGIVAHPDRLEMAWGLAKAVDAELLQFDHDLRGEQANHQAALDRLLFTDADWLLLLEDDAIPCIDFRARVSTWLEGVDGIASLYLGTGRWAATVPRLHEPVVSRLVAEADAAHADRITSDALWHAVAVAVPLHHARSLHQGITRTHAPTDQAVSMWCKRHGVSVTYAHPSFVDHRDERAAVGHQADVAVGPRRAWRFADDVASLL